MAKFRNTDISNYPFPWPTDYVQTVNGVGVDTGTHNITLTGADIKTCPDGNAWSICDAITYIMEMINNFVEEAPLDGYAYARQGGQRVIIPRFFPVFDGQYPEYEIDFVLSWGTPQDTGQIVIDCGTPYSFNITY